MLVEFIKGRPQYINDDWWIFYKHRIDNAEVYYKKVMTLEDYIIETINDLKNKLEELEKNKKDYSSDYLTMFNRYHAQIDILYQCLTAHNNNYKKEIKK